MTTNSNPAGNIPTDTNGDVTLGTVLALLADEPVVTDDATLTSQYSPSAGRVGIDSTDTVYLGDGTAWNAVGETTGLDLAGLPGVQVVRSADDLPDASGGVRQLEAGTAYLFTDFVADTATLRLGDPATPLLGWHGSQAGYIHTGGGVAIKSRGEPFMCRDLYLHAPGGQVFDLQADASTEMLVESISLSDAAGLGTIADLGTIDGYRVPSFKSVNFEQFGAGLTLTGTSEKVVFQGCPFRQVSASGVTIIEADANFETDILKLSSDSYVKDVQSDTEVLRVDPAATINEYTKYINVDHDGSLTRSNALVGQVGAEEVGTIVRTSFPLADSSIQGELDLDAQATVTGSGAGPVKVDDGTYTLAVGERVSNPSPGVLEYEAQYDRDIEVDARVTVVGANTEFSVWIGLNGSRLTRSRVDGSTSGSSKPDTVSTTAIIRDMTATAPEDQVSVYLENTGGTTDLDVATLTLRLLD